MIKCTQHEHVNPAHQPVGRRRILLQGVERDRTLREDVKSPDLKPQTIRRNILQGERSMPPHPPALKDPC